MKTIRESVLNSVVNSVHHAVMIHVVRIVYDADSGRARSSVMKSLERPVYETVFRNFLRIENLAYRNVNK